MATNNSSNQKFTNNSDGFTIGGGTTERDLTLSSGNITLSGGGSNTYTFPGSTDTLVGRASTDTLTNKTITDTSNLISYQTFTNPYKFFAYLSGNLGAITAGTKITYNAAVYDTGSNFNTSLNRFVAPASGYYVFIANINATYSSATYNQLQFYKNGSAYIQGGFGYYGGAGGSWSSNGTTPPILLAANDYIEVFYQGDTTSTVRGGANPYPSFFAGFLLFPM